MATNVPPTDCPTGLQTSGVVGSGGYLIDCDDQDVKDLRLDEPRPVNLDKLKLPQASEFAYVEASKSAQGRNRLQYYLLTKSDEVCIGHKSDILAMASTINSSLSGMTSLLGGLGSIVTGEAATRALSGSAAIFNAWQDNFNQNVYYNNFADAIVKQIDTQRKQVLQEIEPKKSQDLATYSPEAAVFDVVRYHNLCSFSEGVAALANQDKRPATADELKGRIAALRTEMKNNAELVTDPPDDASKALLAANKTMAKMIEALTLQLAFIQGTAVASPSPPGETPSGGSGDASPANNDGAGSGNAEHKKAGRGSAPSS